MKIITTHNLVCRIIIMWVNREMHLFSFVTTHTIIFLFLYFVVVDAFVVVFYVETFIFIEITRTHSEQASERESKRERATPSDVKEFFAFYIYIHFTVAWRVISSFYYYYKIALRFCYCFHSCFSPFWCSSFIYTFFREFCVLFCVCLCLCGNDQFARQYKKELSKHEGTIHAMCLVAVRFCVAIER
jgi:hypothetical protein